jgi:hypothetical protein
MKASHTLRWLSFLLILIGSVAGVSQVFSVKQLHCALVEKESCPPELTARLQQLMNRSLFATDFQAEAQAATAQTVYEFTKIEKRLPNQLTLTFQQAAPLYRLRHQNSEHTVSESGSLFFSATDEKAAPLLITIAGESPFTPEGSVSSELQRPLGELAKNLSQASITPREVLWISPQEIRLVLSENTTALLDHTNPAGAVQQLAIILKSEEYQAAVADAEGKIEVDLRFKLPVLRRAQ